ncbi:hypothetical protein ACTWPT_58345 [Nonomuraea sp. 3N208]|uniref:hypothetical protein n=1 Tax=Nonomuraea sp. 3N208 TaxID=3457421 RepID=UPI003FCF2028
MDLVIAPAGTRVNTWRVPIGWPLLSFTSFSGQLVVLRVDHLSPAVARWFASTLARAADAFAREVDVCFTEGEPGWLRRSGALDLSGVVLVPLSDPPGVAAVPALSHRPPYPAHQATGAGGELEGPS